MREGGRRASSAVPELPFRLEALVPTVDGASVAVVVNGGKLGRVDASVPRSLGLHPGMTVDIEIWARLAPALAERAAFESGVRLLSRRARARTAVELRLRATYGPEAAQRAVTRLQPYLDDAAFATAWVQERLRLRPAGAAALVAGLCREGVDRGLARATVAAVLGPEAGDQERARCLDLARVRLARMPGVPEAQAARRLWAYLARKGFSSEAVAAAVRQAMGNRAADVEI